MNPDDKNERRDETILGQNSPEPITQDLDAGLAAAFGEESSSPPGTSVLQSLGQTTGSVPKVTLKSPPGQGEGPVVRPGSKQMDGATLPPDSRYRLDGEIARGGMGAIVRGRDVDLGRDLAVKVLLSQHQNKPEVIQRFVEEAQIGGQLQHPGIVPVYELGQFGDQRPFFTMKLVKGRTLSALLVARNDPSDDRGRFLGIFEQVCQTIAYAHSRGVIHRDLKPANVMVGAFGEVQVMDWGLAKVLAEGGVADEKRAEDTRESVSIIQTIRSLGSDAQPGIGSGTGGGSHTQMGSVLGTPAYMPPEQALGEIDRLDERSDVFGLGAILCEILIGQPPYTGEDHTEVFRKAARAKLGECFERLDQCGADRELVELVHDCLQPEPDDRPRDAGSLSKQVTHYLESVEQRLRETELQRAAEAARVVEERKRRKVIVSLSAVAILSLILTGGGWMWIQQQQAAIAQVEAEQKQDLHQQVSSELSAARALVNPNGEALPETQAVTQAMEAVKRAEGLLVKVDKDETFHQQAATLRQQLETLQEDLRLAAALERAWDADLQQIAQSRSRFNSPLPRSSSERDEDVERKRSQEVSRIDPAQDYQVAFADWGLKLGAADVVEIEQRIKAVHSTLRPTILVSLDRWRRLLSSGATLEQWIERPWSTLDAVDLKSLGGDLLKVQKDGSIIASGPNRSTGYELVFETDKTRLTALRLEAMLDDSLPNKGPGRGPKGLFHLRNLIVTVEPRDSSAPPRRIEFDSAVADYAGELWPVSPEHWEIRDGGGRPHVAVFVASGTHSASESGLRITISNDSLPHRSDTYDDSSLGRFRWSVNSSSRPGADAQWLSEFVERVDDNAWRAEMRAEMRREDHVALIKRANDEAAGRTQPEMVLIGLADYLRSVPGDRIASTASDAVDWRVVSPKELTLELEPGVSFERRDDNSIAFSGHDPEQETITLTTPVGDSAITAFRLELLTVPNQQDAVPCMGRTGIWVRLAELQASLLSGPAAEKETPLPSRQLMLDYEHPFSLAKAQDGDLQSYVAIPEPDQPRAIWFLLAPESPTAAGSLRIRLQTRDTKCLARLRLSVTTDALEVANPQVASTELLRRLSEQDPGSYWVQLAMADAMQSDVPPRMDDALRHATAAVALRPDAATSHEAVLRSLPINQLRASSPSGLLAIAHARRLRLIGYYSRAVQRLVTACLTEGDRLAIERDVETAVSLFRFVRLLDPESPETVHHVGRRLGDQKMYNEAAALYLAGLELAPDSAQLLNGLGNICQLQGDLERAIDYYRQAVAADPALFVAYNNLADVLTETGKATEATSWLKKAVAADPHNAERYNRVGWLYGTLGNKEEEEAWFSKAIDVDPSYTVAYRNLAVELRDAKRWDEAIEVMHRAVEAAPHDVNNHEYLGAMYQLQKKWSDAAVAYRRAVELYPTSNWHRSILANSLVELDRIDEAVQVWEEAIPLVPHNRSDPLNNLAVLLANVDRLAEAAVAFQEVVQLYPQSKAIASSAEIVG